MKTNVDKVKNNLRTIKIKYCVKKSCNNEIKLNVFVRKCGAYSKFNFVLGGSKDRCVVIIAFQIGRGPTTTEGVQKIVV